MKRRLLPLLLALLLLVGCSAQPNTPAAQLKQYRASFLTLFDTVTVILGYAENEEAFTEQAQAIHDELEVYHRLFDIYNDYDGINNLKTVNDNAGIAPVEVDRRMIDLLLYCRDIYERTGGRVNVAMGSVLKLWHDARSEGYDYPPDAALPDADALKEAALHVSFDTVIIDEAASTVFITDSAQRLDVGAVAKGWSAEQVRRALPSGIMLNLGGNVCSSGPKPDGNAPWVVGIQHPDGEATDYIRKLNITAGAVVTSGDYQRYYVVDGVRYHHIIDPDTLYPANYWRSVSIVCDDSALADALSTALYTLPLDEGKALLDKFGAEALWMDSNGELYYSDGFEAYIKN